MGSPCFCWRRAKRVSAVPRGQDDLAGFSVDAPGGDDLEVLVAVDDLGGERRHVLVNTTAGRSMSRGSVRFLLSHYGYGRGYYSKAGARRSPLNLVTTHFDLSRNANRRRSDRKRSAKNTVNASFSEEPEEREGCDASGRTDIHPANPESQASDWCRIGSGVSNTLMHDILITIYVMDN